MSQEQPLPPPPIIELVKVSKFYPPDIEALSDISFAIKKGDSLFIPASRGEFTVTGNLKLLETRT